MIEKLKKIIKRFEELKVPCTSKIMAASQSLKHVIYWGVSVPTTCCYQYIKERNDIEVYQMFMCPGLGTSYRRRCHGVIIAIAETQFNRKAEAWKPLPIEYKTQASYIASPRGM